MCTAIAYKTKDLYFGRNLDLEYSYRETVTITPRNYPFSFRKADAMGMHYTMIGIATVVDGYPLYYDAVNEHGLCIAALNFPCNAFYHPEASGKDNITPYELIPWLLGQCKTVSESYRMLTNVNLLNTPFSKEFSLTPLHWMIADKKESMTIEPAQDGLKLFSNPVGVLTNNPPFDYHMHNLCNYMNLTAEPPENRFSSRIELSAFSRGMGSIGLPGDLSSQSRFIRAAFTKLNSVSDDTEPASVSQFFHILGSVSQQRGCVKVNDSYEKTVYSSCCNADKGIYYYRTYDNSQLTAVHLFHEDMDRHDLISYPLITEQQIRHEN